MGEAGAAVVCGLILAVVWAGLRGLWSAWRDMREQDRLWKQTARRLREVRDA